MFLFILAVVYFIFFHNLYFILIFILFFKGITRIGTPDAKIAQDIIVQGTGVENEHCFIENTTGVITLYPLAKMCAVDGILAAGPTRLSQGKLTCVEVFKKLQFLSSLHVISRICGNSNLLWLICHVYKKKLITNSEHCSLFLVS